MQCLYVSTVRPQTSNRIVLYIDTTPATSPGKGCAISQNMTQYMRGESRRRMCLTSESKRYQSLQCRSIYNTILLEVYEYGKSLVPHFHHEFHLYKLYELLLILIHFHMRIGSLFPSINRSQYCRPRTVCFFPEFLFRWISFEFFQTWKIVNSLVVFFLTHVCGIA